MEQINSKEYWASRFSSGDWMEMGGPDQSVFFAKVAYSAMPAFLKRELSRNNWRVVDIGCATGDGTAQMAKYFPNCHFIGQDVSTEAIDFASVKYPNCEFAVSDINNELTPADVVYSSNTLEHIKNPRSLMEKMCSAASKYVVHLLPLEDMLDIPEHINIFSLDFFPVRMGDFYLESYAIVDCTKLDNSRWPGKQLLLVYTNSKYRSESMTLQDIHENYSTLEKRMLEDARKKIWEQETHLHEVIELCNWREHLLENANQQLEDLNNQLQEIPFVFLCKPKVFLLNFQKNQNLLFYNIY